MCVYCRKKKENDNFYRVILSLSVSLCLLLKKKMRGGKFSIFTKKLSHAKGECDRILFQIVEFFEDCETPEFFI